MLVVAELFVTGCSPIVFQTDTLYNNSGQSLTLIAEVPNSYMELVKNADHEEFYALGFAVRHSAGLWHYENQFVWKSRFVKKADWNTETVNLQIQPNGAIYVIRPDSTGTVTNFPRQPKGFPLMPN